MRMRFSEFRSMNNPERNIENFNPDERINRTNTSYNDTSEPDIKSKPSSENSELKELLNLVFKEYGLIAED